MSFLPTEDPRLLGQALDAMRDVQRPRQQPRYEYRQRPRRPRPRLRSSLLPAMYVSSLSFIGLEFGQKLPTEESVVISLVAGIVVFGLSRLANRLLYPRPRRDRYYSRRRNYR